jgi:hypothetical protein
MKLLRCKRKNFEVHEDWPERWRQQMDCEEEEDEEDEEEEESQQKKKGQQIEVLGNLP